MMEDDAKMMKTFVKADQDERWCEDMGGVGVGEEP